MVCCVFAMRSHNVALERRRRYVNFSVLSFLVWYWTQSEENTVNKAPTHTTQKANIELNRTVSRIVNFNFNFCMCVWCWTLLLSTNSSLNARKDSQPRSPSRWFRVNSAKRSQAWSSFICRLQCNQWNLIWKAANIRRYFDRQPTPNNSHWLKIRFRFTVIVGNPAVASVIVRALTFYSPVFVFFLFFCFSCFGTEHSYSDTTAKAFSILLLLFSFRLFFQLSFERLFVLCFFAVLI